MKLLISVLLILHGLIVAGQSAGSFGITIPNEVQNPSFISWFPINMGRSWLLSLFGLQNSLPAYRITGILWLFGGLILVVAGLGMFGMLVPVLWWRGLALAGAAFSLFMLLLYFHPLMIIGTASSIAVLITLGWFHSQRSACFHRNGFPIEAVRGEPVSSNSISRKRNGKS